MQLLYWLEVKRMRDAVVVARTTPKALDSRLDNTAARADARNLSAVYGPKFYCEVWAVYVCDGIEENHRAYTMHNGRTVQAVGF